MMASCHHAIIHFSKLLLSEAIKASHSGVPKEGTSEDTTIAAGHREGQSSGGEATASSVDRQFAPTCDPLATRVEKHGALTRVVVGCSGRGGRGDGGALGKAAADLRERHEQGVGPEHGIHELERAGGESWGWDGETREMRRATGARAMRPIA